MLTSMWRQSVCVSERLPWDDRGATTLDHCHHVLKFAVGEHADIHVLDHQRLWDRIVKINKGNITVMGTVNCFSAKHLVQLLAKYTLQLISLRV